MSHEMQISADKKGPSSTLAVPLPRVPIAIRTAGVADLAFIDSLQKPHTKQLGYFATQQFKGYIEAGNVLVAEEGVCEPPHPGPRSGGEGVRLGYIISKDRYLKRDELGVIFQLCVDDSVQRKLVGAALVQAAFDRSAYGCRLYCCWCAQDLDANYFWESLGFVPIAFRGGSTGKKRVHIFWQRRIREGDTATPWWFPAKTDSGAMREDRLVFPIPPGLHWSDEMPVLKVTNPNPKQIRSANAAPPAPLKAPPLPPPRRVQFGSRPTRSMPQPPPATENPKPRTKPPADKPPAAKIDPKLITGARELRDRYLEHINSPGNDPAPKMKYEVSRQIEHRMAAAPAQHPATALPSPRAA